MRRSPSGPSSGREVADPRGPAPSLLAVFAHPDDESIACGGLLARCCAEAIPTTLLCLTRGGLGQVDDPARARMGELRARELTAAARTLGVRDVTLLDYRNGFLPWVDKSVLEADIATVLRRVRPGVVVTFDDDGLYWHPDHIVVHERTTAAVSTLADEGPALYYVQVPKGAMRKAWQAATRAAEARGDLETVQPFVLGVEVDAYGLFTTPPTLALDVSAQAVTKLRALRCHTSQLLGDALDRLPEDGAAEALGLELYRRAAVGAQLETFLDRMCRPL
jgi:LmbE family N-acetylglucosaminyl deacetylase